ncbi:MAG: PEP-CTERM/exosortase system-associated acyltransferase [Pseudomonas sp.]|uniref:PEP-CTERM/exosortase system-associated acyltransferase n=1 Tax=Pseudomonas sp. TaxID=306 RepID=UPI00339947B2
MTPWFDFTTLSPADSSSALLTDIHRLRHEVYCVERGFLDPAQHPDGLERDEYDRCSVHIGASSLDGDLVGTVRLVQPNGGMPFPFEDHCALFDTVALPPREQVAEISRLIVKKTYRRRRGDSLEGVSAEFLEKGSAAAILPPAPSGDARSNSPLLLLGMYREMYRYSRANGVRYWLAAMERALARSLDRMGVKFVPIGPKSEYYGPVTLHLIDLDVLEQSMRTENKFLAAWFSDEPIPTWMMLETVLGGLAATGSRPAPTPIC